eukprot:scaffold1739_cov242-Pinguiococcus_pyrenoidosus.AAC.5
MPSYSKHHWSPTDFFHLRLQAAHDKVFSASFLSSNVYSVSLLSSGKSDVHSYQPPKLVVAGIRSLFSLLVCACSEGLQKAGHHGFINRWGRGVELRVPVDLQQPRLVVLVRHDVNARKLEAAASALISEERLGGHNKIAHNHKKPLPNDWILVSARQARGLASARACLSPT